MLTDLKNQFVREFVSATQTRLRDSLSLLSAITPGAEETVTQVAEKMHTIAGEAMLIGLGDVALFARAGAGAARRYLELRNPTALTACTRALRALGLAVEDLGITDGAGPPAPAPVRSAPNGGEQHRIIVVDDSPLNGALLREGLEQAGFHALYVEDDLHLIIQRMTQFQPHVALIDLVMPRCSTVELCRRIRRSAKLGETRILLVTSLPIAEAEVEAKNLGVLGAVSKEQGLASIIKRVQLLVKEQP